MKTFLIITTIIALGALALFHGTLGLGGVIIAVEDGEMEGLLLTASAVGHGLILLLAIATLAYCAAAKPKTVVREIMIPVEVPVEVEKPFSRYLRDRVPFLNRN